MTPFSIAGVQMRVSAIHDNLAEMQHRLEMLMMRYPWVQMVVFSELCAYGPNPAFAVPAEMPNSYGRNGNILR